MPPTPGIVRDRNSGRVLDWTWGDRRDALITIDDGDIAPREGEISVSVTFANKLPWSVDVFWQSYQGKGVLYATLDPGENLAQQTFETRPRRIRQTHSGDEIALYIASAAPAQTCDIALKSVSSAVATEIRFVNSSPLTLDVFWMDFKGKEKKYATVAPRESYTQSTYMTYPWIVRDARSGEAVGFTDGLRAYQDMVLTGAATMSRDIGKAVKLTFTNGSGLRTDVMWVNHDGEEVKYTILDPGAHYRVSTYPLHTWRLREAEGGAELDLYIADRTPVQDHSIRNALVRTSERANAEL